MRIVLKKSWPLLLFALILAVSPPVLAQVTDTEPRLPPAPSPAPGATPGSPFGVMGTENYAVTSSANEHGSYLWIVAPIQRIVVLCEKTNSSADFSCARKRLP